MRILSQPAEIQSDSRNVCAAIGVFDGVHIGHQSVVRRMMSEAAKSDALSVVVTFDRHPRSLLTPETTPRLVQTQRQKLAVFEGLGVDAVWMIRFDADFSRIPGRDFVVSMQQGFKSLRCVTVGTEFHFGHKRSGNATRLAEWGNEFGFSTLAVPPVEFAGAPVSSTRVREAISSGRLDDARSMLGRCFALEGQVVRGDQIGRKLGFPTANLDVAGMVIPPPGVYSCRCKFGGRAIKAAVNIGHRPTLENPTPATRVEAHLIDWQGDLYDRDLEVEFIRQLRPETKFPSLDALREQIKADLAQIRVEPA